jgi:hypothetical protein
MKLIAAVLVCLSLIGCGKKRILVESNHIQGLASESRVLADSIASVSNQPDVVSAALQISDKQSEILDRSRAVSIATADVEDKADDISAWWGDFFLGSVENVKWIAIAVLVAVVAFVGYRARVWSLLGSLLKPFRSRSSGQ